ncbi:ABC transporter [Allomyces macrogynus ATCC 38327]|uniref:ABC transporter n=1 Tax=Allomyces macrogynus (strain ATCC 38327) TaxID=578462 RepID=A0A0L0T9C5_ALLM3|nr:ABC transporter [Allomyces macrogynus ATCC 38327]|eukprot:KNE71315.1 ABC transporter [Allomyces macrogynus ATCC 38327]
MQAFELLGKNHHDELLNSAAAGNVTATVSRIFSVLPSATEILCLLPGFDELLVGRNHEWDYPRCKTTFTTSADVDRQVSEALSQGNSLYTLDIPQIQQLKPNMILTQDICDVCAIELQTVQRVAKGMKPSPTVLTLNPALLRDVLVNTVEVSDAVGAPKEVRAIFEDLVRRVKAAEQWSLANVKQRPNVAFIEWVDPPATLVETRPDILLIAPCGLDFDTTKRELRLLLDRADAWWWQLNPRPKRVILMNGKHHFNRPGPRLVDALEFVQALLHRPELLLRFESKEYTDKDGVGFPYEELGLGYWFDKTNCMGKAPKQP